MAFVLTWGAGCNRPATPTQATATYKFEMRRPGGAFQRAQGTTIALTMDNTSVSIQDGRLSMNGKSYGTLNDGDSVLIDENDQVTVNGAARTADAR
jgi:hypothetical protein